jgi:hypothetical protein
MVYTPVASTSNTAETNGSQPSTALMRIAPAKSATDIFVNTYARREITVRNHRHWGLKRRSRYSGMVNTLLFR